MSFQEYRATTEASRQYRHALHLYSLGFSLIPISRYGKKPVVKWKSYQTTRCTPQNLVEWFLERDYQIGIVTGEVSGIVVIDCDTFDATDTLLDYTTIERDCVESMVRQTTPHGLHHVYRHPGVRTPNRNRSCLNDAIDVRGDGGYVLAYGDSFSWTIDHLTKAPLYVDLPRSDKQHRVHSEPSTN